MLVGCAQRSNRRVVMTEPVCVRVWESKIEKMADAFSPPQVSRPRSRTSSSTSNTSRSLLPCDGSSVSSLSRTCIPRAANKQTKPTHHLHKPPYLLF